MTILMNNEESCQPFHCGFEPMDTMLSITPIGEHSKNLSVKASFSKCQLENRKKIFLQSNCISPISVGQGLKVHEGKKLYATLLLVNSSFKKYTLLIDDTIQRHTLKIFNKDEEEVIKKCLLEGDLWLERNKSICDLLTIEYKTLRWNDWLNHPEYTVKRDLMAELYSNNDLYKEAVNFTIHEYLFRIRNRGTLNFDEDHAFYCCLEYLLEECAVMCLWGHEGYDFELYPTGRNLAMKAAYEIVVQKEYPGKLMSVSLHFRKVHV